MTNVSPASLSDTPTQSDPASAYVAKRLSRRSAFQKAGAIGLAGALLLGVGVGAGHAAGSGGGSKTPGGSQADDYTFTIRGHGPDGLVATSEGIKFHGATEKSPSFHIELGGVAYHVHPSLRGVALASKPRTYISATVAVETSKPRTGPGQLTEVTVDVWEHTAALEAAKQTAIERSAWTREQAANHAAKLNAEGAAAAK